MSALVFSRTSGRNQDLHLKETSGSIFQYYSLLLLRTNLTHGLNHSQNKGFHSASLALATWALISLGERVRGQGGRGGGGGGQLVVHKVN